jgi:nucleoside-diphosphate-sugar epimerase
VVGAERRHRLLKHEADLAAADLTDEPALRVELTEVDALATGTAEPDLSALDAARALDDAQDRARGDALAAARFTDDAKRPAGLQSEAGAVDRPYDTLVLLEVGLDSGVKKIINASSSSVYGKVEYLPFDESHPNQPVSPYGVSKLLAEHYCRVFEELYGLRSVSLRYFTVYSPRMRPDLAISIFTKAL